MSESRFVASLEVTARAAALFVAVVYGTGFLIISVHHAQYGIAQFDPLKPKIFSTGVVFLLLAALPIVAAFRLFRIFGLRAKAAVGIACKPENEKYLKIINGFSFLPATVILSIFVGFFFERFDDPKPWGVTYFLLVMGVYAALALFQAKYFDKHPFLFLLADFLTMALLVAVMYRFQDHHQMVLSLWFYGVGIGAVILYRYLQPERIKQFEWERHFPSIALVLLTYSTAIYGRIRPSFGGGMPTPVVFYLSAKTPILNSDSPEVLLLEETDHGYYILASAQEQTAYFLRRDLVVAMHFLKKGK